MKCLQETQPSPVDLLFSTLIHGLGNKTSFITQQTEINDQQVTKKVINHYENCMNNVFFKRNRIWTTFVLNDTGYMQKYRQVPRPLSLFFTWFAAHPLVPVSFYFNFSLLFAPSSCFHPSFLSSFSNCTPPRSTHHYLQLHPIRFASTVSVLSFFSLSLSLRYLKPYGLIVTMCVFDDYSGRSVRL